MTCSRRWLPVLLFLAAVCVLLFRAREFTGWGGGPEAALGALELRPSSAPGFGLVLMAAKLFSLLPVEGSAVFGLNAAGALAGALGLGLLACFLVRRGISPGLVVVAPLILLVFPRFWEVCGGFEGAAVFLLFAAAFFLWDEGWPPGSARFNLFVLFVGLGLAIHPAPVVMGLLLAGASVPFRGAKKWAAGAAKGGVFVLAAATVPLMFFLLRPALDMNWGSTLSAALIRGGESEYDSLVAILANPIETKRFLAEFGASATGIFLPAVLCLPLLLTGRAPRFPVAATLLFLPVYFLVFMLSPHRDTALAMALIAAAVCVAGALGLQRLALCAKGWLLRAAVVCWALVVVAVPVSKGFSWEKFFAPDYSGVFARGVVENLPRDAVFLVRGGEEPLLNFAAVQRVEGVRGDVGLVYPMYFSSKGYRELLRKKWAGGLVFPSEGQYTGALEEVNAAVLGAEGEMGQVMKERMNEMTWVIIEEAVAGDNSEFRDVYYSSVGHLVETSQMGGAGFAPEYFSFRLITRRRAVFDVGRLLELSESPLRNDPAAARAMGRYFADIGENFFRKKEIPRAEEFLARSAGCDPENARAHFFLGLLHREDGRYDEATDELNRAKTLLEAERGTGDLMHTTRVFMLARIYQELGIEIEAEKMFKKIEN